MQAYKAPLKEIAFLLDVFGYDKNVHSLEAYADYDKEAIIEIARQAGNFCANEMQAVNRLGDEKPIKYDPKTRSVTMPEEITKVYKHFVQEGMGTMTHPVEYGGGGAPHVMECILSEISTATNKSLTMCPGLTKGLVESLHHHGSKELKDAYLPKLITGEWSGTMCLTEPQSGTDLGLVKTKAEVFEDHYILTGTKIWITFGDHDMTDNIVHLVLARLPDAPKGIRGISLFLVPKFTLEGKRNGIYCGGIEHKMGIKASPTCVMNMEDAEGWLIGDPHKGMRGMFTMMNNARLGVGLEGIALGDISYQVALDFCKDRRQSRSLDKTKQELDHPADTIMVHPDVRRQLLNIKSTNETMRGLALWVAQQLDISKHHPDENVREEADDIVELLTPIIKSFMTERGFLNTNDAMQVMGGAGYTTDWNVEQYMRDLRISMIYEGTNHIQALDLLGRKLPRNNGRSYMRFNEKLTQFIRENKENEQMTEFLGYLKDSSKKLMNLTMELSGKALEDREVAGAVASHYLNVFAFTALSYIWCRQVKVALENQDKGQYYKTKIKTARYFFKHILPESDALIKIIQEGKDCIMDFDVDEF